ncbi:helix-turn-helix domain-containing protein [Actinophytocola gossypii]|uniref:Helix-turn-helix domain-containing protein n=1 Tax=Actinophytocola gossypii TaxID=2812003 RepID=A0ABT2JJ24_9PSEU|nr:helix-turn-helix domain-containing protein [Actinophytocola gossypii]
MDRLPADPPVLYTTEEAADILRVRKGWLERQAAARKIPFSLLGGCYRFTARHLNEIVHIFEPGPNSPTPNPPSDTTRRRANTSVSRTTSQLRAKPRARAA